MRFSTFHVGQLAGDRTSQEVLQAQVHDAILAEQLGFEACWIAEHHFSRYGSIVSPVAVMAAIAAQTTTIRIASGVAVLPFYTPLRLAEDLALIDNLSNGRLVAGLGPGFSPLEYRGMNVDLDERRDRFFEGVEIIVRAWTEGSFSHRGPFFTIHDTEIFPKPVQQPYPMIVHAATKQSSQTYAAELGRPILIGRLGDEGIHDGLTNYAQVRRNAGHREIDILRSLEWCGVLRHVVVLEDGDEARLAALDAAATYLRLADGLGPPHSELVQGIDAEEPRDLLDRGAIVGSPDEVIAEIGHLHQLGVHHLICWFDWGGIDRTIVDRSMRLFASAVMPVYAPRSTLVL